MSDNKLVWGQRWDSFRETLRGHFHMIFGILAWVFLHLMSIPNWLVWTLLIVIGGSLLFLDGLRVQIVRALRDEDNPPITRWRQKRIQWLVAIIRLYQIVLSRFHLLIGREYRFTNLRDWFEPKHKWALGHWLRKQEEFSHAAAFHFVAGMVFVYIFFPIHVVVFAVLFQGVADPTAKWVGMHTGFVRFKKPPLIANKSLGGVGAGFAACVMAGFMVLSFDLAVIPLFPESVSIPSRLAMIWVGCAVAPIAELFGGKWDNFWIPVVSGFAMWAML